MDERATVTIRQAEWSVDALERISELRVARGLIEEMMIESVRERRRGGRIASVEEVDGETKRGEVHVPISWGRIGRALGVSKQAARERFRSEAEGCRGDSSGP